MDHLDFRPDRLRNVVNVGLRPSGLPELKLRDRPPGGSGRRGPPGDPEPRALIYDVPPLDQLAGADPTWRDILDTLRPPRTRKQPEWAWRVESPRRPVTFEPATTLAAEAVQLHLQHKLTRRCCSHRCA